MKCPAECYPGCWGDHAKSEHWTQTEIPQHLIDQYVVDHPGGYYPEMGVVKQIVDSENIEYGTYVILEKGRGKNKKYFLAVAPREKEPLVNR